MAVDLFLKIEGIPGESKDKEFKEHIDVLSYSWGASQPASSAYGGGGGAGKANFQDFSFMMRINKSTPKLLEHCATGVHIKKAELLCRKAGGKQQTYLKYTMFDLLVSSYQTSASSEDPMESCSMNFAKVEMEYKEQDAKGGLGGGVFFKYDIKGNTKY